MAKILLVEDDNNLREIYEARLQAEGYDIVAAQDGEAALVVAKSEQPDLVISDVMMPRISGFEMLDILRNTQGMRDVKVIMLTALGQAEDKTRADKLGADRYLVKSQVTLEDIVHAASELLGGNAAAGDTPAAAAPEPEVAAVTPTPAPVPVAATPVPVPTPVTAAPAPEPAAPPTPVAVDPVPVPDPAVLPEPVITPPAPEPSAIPTSDVSEPQTSASPTPIADVFPATPPAAAPTDTPQAAPAPEPAVAPASDPIPAGNPFPPVSAAPEPTIDPVAAPAAISEPEPSAIPTPDIPEPRSATPPTPVENGEQAIADTLQSLIGDTNTAQQAPAIPETPAPTPEVTTPETPAVGDPGAAASVDTPQEDTLPTPGDQEQAALPEQTPEAAPTPVTPPETEPTPNPIAAPMAEQATEDNSDTTTRKKIIRPLDPTGQPVQPDLNELLAKEGITDFDKVEQQAPAAAYAAQAQPTAGMPQPHEQNAQPHAPGHVITPNPTQPTNSDGKPIDPSSIAL